MLCATEALTKTRMPDVVQSKQQQTNVDSLLLLITLASEDHFFLLLLGASIPELIQFTFTWAKQENMCLFLFISNTLLHTLTWELLSMTKLLSFGQQPNCSSRGLDAWMVKNKGGGKHYSSQWRFFPHMLVSDWSGVSTGALEFNDFKQQAHNFYIIL